MSRACAETVRRPVRFAADAMRRDNGFSLVEVLVALLIMAVGMTGMATLLAHTLLTTRTTMTRTLAFSLGADMTERIRANRRALMAYTGTATDHECDRRAPFAPCSGSERAEQDLFDWQASVAALLPDGSGSVVLDTSTSPVTVTVILRWYEAGGSPDGITRYAHAFPVAER